MPIRKTPLITDYYYHLFNRSTGRIPIFTCKSDFLQMINLLNYYRFKNVPFPFSQFKKTSKSERETALKDLRKNGEKLVDIICFCLMPNHFHLLLKQLKDKGIIIFLGRFQNSYAKYFNIKYKRSGPLFQNRFKAVLIEDENQLLHVNRYIHLNPYSSLVVKNKKDIIFYQWSSLLQYLNNGSEFCQMEVVLEQFKSKKNYLDFILDQADYQRNLEKIKHLTCE